MNPPLKRALTVRRLNGVKKMRVHAVEVAEDDKIIVIQKFADDETTHEHKTKCKEVAATSFWQAWRHLQARFFGLTAFIDDVDSLLTEDNQFIVAPISTRIQSALRRLDVTYHGCELSEVTFKGDLWLVNPNSDELLKIENGTIGPIDLASKVGLAEVINKLLTEAKDYAVGKKRGVEQLAIEGLDEVLNTTENLGTAKIIGAFETGEFQLDPETGEVKAA